MSRHTMTEDGTKANDTFLSSVETCKKLSGNASEYIVDRMPQTFELPSLAQIIRAKSGDHLHVSAPPECVLCVEIDCQMVEVLGRQKT